MSRFCRPLLLALLVLVLANVCFVSCRHPSSNVAKGKGKAVEIEYSEESTNFDDVKDVGEAAKPAFDASRLTWAQILDKFDLDVPGHLAKLLDYAHTLFEEHTKDTEFSAGNAIMSALKASFRRTLEPALKASNRPQGTLQPVTVDELFSVMQDNFLEIVKSDSHVKSSRLQPFVTEYVPEFFKSLKDMYRAGYKNGLSLNWTMVFLFLQSLDLIPTNIFFRDTFSEFLSVPDQLKQSLHDILEDVLSGDYAHYVRMILSFAKTIDWQNVLRNEKVEL